jgi:hypothetical protein
MKRALEVAEGAVQGLGVDFPKAGEFLQCVNTDLKELLELAKVDISDAEMGRRNCEFLLENRQDVRRLAKKVAHGATALNQFGTSLANRKEKDINVAIWGWVGFTIKADTLAKIGKQSTGGAKGMTWVKDHVDKNLASCEREFILEHLLALASRNRKL